jgi:pyruvate,water dikinase
MRQASAILTAVGGVASHMATIAREYRVPALSNVAGALEIPVGETITVDASGGAVYAGECRDLIKARQKPRRLLEDVPVFDLLKQILTRVSPLNLLDSSDDNFTADQCRTFHDIIRYAHQMGIEEMLKVARSAETSKRISRELVSEIPMKLQIVLIDEDGSNLRGRLQIQEDEIASEPMRAFWSGIKRQGWPKAQSGKSHGAHRVVSPRRRKRHYGETSFAILSREYMMLSLHLGYHFTTVEAMCTEEETANFIRMQYKEGGASRDRRIRRVRLISTVLGHLGFEQQSQGDFLNSSVSDLEPQQIKDNLVLLGRITMMTKQLDMALSNDAIADWYTRDIMRQLGMGKEEKYKPSQYD